MKQNNLAKKYYKIKCQISVQRKNKTNIIKRNENNLHLNTKI